MSGLVLPKRVFLDTSHLVYLTKVQRGLERDIDKGARDRIPSYRTILERMRGGELLPLVMDQQAEEWSPDGNVAGGMEIAAVLDTAPCRYLISAFGMVANQECLAEIRRVFQRPVEPIPPVVNNMAEPNGLLAFLFKTVPSVAAAFRASMYHGFHKGQLHIPPSEPALRHDSARDWLRTSVRCDRLESRSGDGYVWRMNEDAVRAAAPDAPDRTAPFWMVRARLAQSDLLAEFIVNSKIPVSVESAVGAIDLERCPALMLWSEFWRRFADSRFGPRASRKPRPLKRNDQIDIEGLAAYAYADFSLTEAHVGNLVRQSRHAARKRVFVHPDDLLEAINCAR